MIATETKQIPARISGKIEGKEKRLLDFDLFFLLSYMATIAVADIPRGKIFEHAARLPSVASRFFREIDFMVKKLGYDYVEACRLVGSRAEEEVKNFLFRFSDAMRSGERESDFLFREAQIYAVEYENRYNRKLESLKKWTDAFAAMAISARTGCIMPRMASGIMTML